MSHHKVIFNQIHYSYPDGNIALQDISFEIGDGESWGIIGANGAGKSTLLLLLCGILFPSQGQIRVGDTLLGKKTLSEVRNRLGVVLQNPDDQLFMTNVYEDVAFGPRAQGLSPFEVDTKVVRALETVGILHLKDRAPYKLSGGEKRAAAIASILSMEPDVLVMDEPSSALDPKSRRRLITLVQGFKHSKIIATHDLDMVLELCERVLVLKDGKIVCDGPTSEILANAELMEDSGLELPFAMHNCPRSGSPKI